MHELQRVREAASPGARRDVTWETLRVDMPEIHYARSGNVYIGYQAFGAGPVRPRGRPGGLSNIEVRLGV